MVLFRELDHYFSEPVVARRALFVARAAREEIGDIDSAASRERLSREKQASRDPFNLGPNHNPDTMATEDAWTSTQLLKLLLLYREKIASPPHLFTLHQLVEHQVNSGGRMLCVIVASFMISAFPCTCLQISCSHVASKVLARENVPCHPTEEATRSKSS